MRPPPAAPGHGPAPVSTAPQPQLARAAGACPPRLGGPAGIREHAAPIEDSGQGGQGSALFGRGAPLESGDGSYDERALEGSALSGCEFEKDAPHGMAIASVSPPQVLSCSSQSSR